MFHKKNVSQTPRYCANAYLFLRRTRVHATWRAWLSYNSATYLKERHTLPEDLMRPITAIDGLIEMALQ